MVGGRIIEVRPEGSKTRLWCIDKNDECAIYVETTPELPQPGDQLWWQGRAAFWTPADKRFVEKKLSRVGFSFDPRQQQDRPTEGE